MASPAMTSASNVEEGQEVRIGGRWIVCEGVDHQHNLSGSVERVTLWLEECPRVFDAAAQLAVYA